MDKERLVKTDSGYSEKQMDLAVDQTSTDDQVKASSVFDPQKKKKVKPLIQQPR